mmetsp:Transcript_104457/g.294126  ORF Transcript_104457/g.294126 Transcript_104457/m.294126 type:complete len:483 (-) Transcript_104457:81-1529(-)
MLSERLLHAVPRVGVRVATSVDDGRLDQDGVGGRTTVLAPMPADAPHALDAIPRLKSGDTMPHSDDAAVTALSATIAVQRQDAGGSGAAQVGSERWCVGVVAAGGATGVIGGRIVDGRTRDLDVNEHTTTALQPQRGLLRHVALRAAHRRLAALAAAVAVLAAQNPDADVGVGHPAVGERGWRRHLEAAQAQRHRANPLHTMNHMPRLKQGQDRLPLRMGFCDLDGQFASIGIDSHHVLDSALDPMPPDQRALHGRCCEHLPRWPIRLDGSREIPSLTDVKFKNRLIEIVRHVIRYMLGNIINHKTPPAARRQVGRGVVDCQGMMHHNIPRIQVPHVPLELFVLVGEVVDLLHEAAIGPPIPIVEAEATAVAALDEADGAGVDVHIVQGDPQRHPGLGRLEVEVVLVRRRERGAVATGRLVEELRVQHGANADAAKAGRGQRDEPRVCSEVREFAHLGDVGDVDHPCKAFLVFGAILLSSHV